MQQQQQRGSSSSSSLRIRWFQKSSSSSLFVNTRLDHHHHHDNNNNNNNNNNNDNTIPNNHSDMAARRRIAMNENNKIMDDDDDDDIDDDDDDDNLRLMLWNMLRIAAHEETLEPVQSNPDLAKYVVNVFTTTTDPSNNNMDRHYHTTTKKEQQQQLQLQHDDEHHHENVRRSIIRMGVIADWINNDQHHQGDSPMEEKGIGAAWIQTWSSPSSSASSNQISNPLLLQSTISDHDADASGNKDAHEEDEHEPPNTKTLQPPPSSSPSPPRGYGWVRDDIPELAMGVVPQYQGRGIGTQLLGALIQLVQDHNDQHHQGEQQHPHPWFIPAISLSVREDNLPAVRLYQRHGFQPVPGTHVKNRVGTMSYTMIRWFVEPLPDNDKP